jgi:molecular chaperone HtpG
MNKDKLQDLLIYKNSKDDKYITLEDYLNINPDSDIYYAVAESSDKCSLLPEVKSLIKKGKVVLYCTDDVDEFVFMMLRDYKDKKFINVSSVNDSLEESEETKKLNEDNKDKLAKMKDIIGVSDVLFTDSLDDYPVVLKSVGDVSLGMEKSLKKIPNNDEITSKKVLEINAKHPIKDKLLSLNEEELKEYSNMLYDMSLMVEGLTIKDPAKLAETVIKYLSK